MPPGLLLMSADGTASTTSTPRLEMRDIRKRFGPTVALDGVSIRVMPGEVHALVGQNGAGKSTLMKTLSGAHAPDSGEMLLDGEPYTCLLYTSDAADERSSVDL